MRRILDAARALVVRGGAGAVSIGEVASAAGVSKALVHYHFHEKESLLAQLASAVGRDVLDREEAILSRMDPRPLDAYWTWLRAELAVGDIRVLISLAHAASDAVDRVLCNVDTDRRQLAARHVDRVFAALGLRPRVAPVLLADTMVAFIDGLASAALRDDHDPRPAFDALWLALLTLAEQE